jgi:tetratricopeptide (TPR) repeat protein
LSLAGLAEPGLSRGAIYLIETGRARPSMTTLELIASRTGKPVAHFLAAPPATEWQQATGRLAADVNEAERLYLAGRLPEAVRLCESVIGLVADAHVEARVRRCLGRASLDLGRLDDARTHLGQARDRFTAAGDPWSSAECLVLLAATAVRQGDAGALSMAEEAIAACAALTPPPDPLLAAAQAAAGDALTAREQWDAAFERYGQGLDHARRRSSLGDLAMLCEEAGPAVEARFAAEWQSRATTLRAAERDLALAAEIHLKRGLALQRVQRPEEALEALEAAEAECERLRLRETRVRVLLARAETLVSLGRRADADCLLARAADLAEFAEARLSVATARCLRGRLAASTGDVETRDREFRAALDLLVELDATAPLIDTHIACADALEAAGEVAAALEHWKRAASLLRPSLDSATDGANR